MLSILNSYAHGFVALPVIHALKRNGFFERLRADQSSSLDDLFGASEVNRGYFLAALRLLQSLGFLVSETIERAESYRLTAKGEQAKSIHADIDELLSFSWECLFQGDVDVLRRLNGFLDRAKNSWGKDSFEMAQYLDGLIAIPLLLQLKQRGALVAPLLSAIPNELFQAIAGFFVAHNWCHREGQHLTPTELGREMFARIGITATVASYRPMFRRMDDLLFGNCESVFTRETARDEEGHVDRALNVLGSGFQHGRYFDDMEDALLGIFDDEPLELQPKYLIDTGCGDGTLLKKLFVAVRDRSKRGKSLDRHPLKLVGVDFNEAALSQAAITLQGLDVLLIKGDIGDPEKIMADLGRHGVSCVDDVLHVRSFLDHDRVYRAPADRDAAQARRYLMTDPSAVAHDGSEIYATDLHQSLVEHLHRWTPHLGRHGLCALEVHCVDPDTAARNPDSECAHYDAFHAFSRQLLTKADRFLMAAAEAGMFPRPESFKRYPKTLEFTRITFGQYERRSYIIRTARTTDLAALVELENGSWPAGVRASAETIEQRIGRYPDGQFVLEMAGRLVGCLYSQRIDDVRTLTNQTAATVETRHRTDGAVIQLLSLSINKEFQDQQLGDQLLEFVLQHSSLLSGVSTALGVTRCRDYQCRPDVSLEEYIDLRDGDGFLMDAILRFHELHGAKVKGLVPRYRPGDKANRGYGVLIEYDLFHRRRASAVLNPQMTQAGETTTVRIDRVNVRDYLAELIGVSLKQMRKEDVDFTQPLMEIGLDSGDLLELNQRISTDFGVTLSAVFFFEHNTCEKIASYLESRSAADDRIGVPASFSSMTPQSTRSPRASRDSTTPLASANTRNFKHQNDIAVIGMACRLPGSIETPQQLWDRLAVGDSAIGEVPRDRWTWPEGIDCVEEHRGIDRGGFLVDVARFDAGFFRLSPKEAESMDPQQRLLLELSWECLEDAAYAAKAIAGTATAIYVGASSSDYRALLEKTDTAVDGHWGLGTSMSILANRISYFYDFRGPSIQIDTACSSSLVALHEAMQALRLGTCKQALVAGVHIMCDPKTTIAYYTAGMLAKDGLCKTFDAAADGYVRSEGAVVLMLKPLESAERDGDRIRVVLKGSSVNHGGKASGLTVPSPQAQSELLMTAYESCGINMKTLGYFEAHGTGTPLGDPIEVQGIKLALSGNAVADSFECAKCELGSLKSNLGHLEAVAGLAGLLKVILSMRYETIPPTLHFKALNPKIDLSGTPFRVANVASSWERPRDGVRRAGVSSFGSGGTNAHVIAEEYVETENVQHKTQTAALRRPTIIAISAKSAERLDVALNHLLSHVDQTSYADTDLVDIAYTLQVGREAMEHRVALVVDSILSLKEKLRIGVTNQNNSENVFRGEVKANSAEFAILNSSNELQSVVVQWMRNARYTELAAMWVKGLPIEWKALYGDVLPKRISLPTYPFARDRHWLAAKAELGIRTADRLDARKGTLHPLPHKNSPSSSVQRFRSDFVGDEFFLRDHIINNSRILPGVAYLEMMRAAMMRLSVEGVSRANSASTLIQLRDVVWTRPFAVNRPASLRIDLKPIDAGEVTIEVLSASDEHMEPDGTLHAQARARFVSSVSAPAVDVERLINLHRKATLSAEQCYAALRNLGLNLGAAFFGITELLESTDLPTPSVVARIELPLQLRSTVEEYFLHPVLLDSGLQACLALVHGLTGSVVVKNRLAVPFALGRLDIYSPMPPRCYAWVRYSDGSRPGESVEKLDIDYIDESGRVCVRLTGFSIREFTQPALHQHPMLLLTRRWLERTGLAAPMPVYSERYVIVIDESERKSECSDCLDGSLEEELLRSTPAKVFRLSSASDIHERYERHVVQILELVRNIVANNHDGRILLQVIASGDQQGMSLGLVGVIKTIGLEHAKIVAQLIVTEDARSRADQLQECSRFARDNVVRYFAGARHVPEWHDVPRNAGTADVWRDRGVYLITGGAGGLGRLFAREIASKVKEPIIILVGRSQLSDQCRAEIESVRLLGAQVEYRSVDIESGDQTVVLVESILSKFGVLHGVLHAAGTVRDRFISKKTSSEVAAVLGPKVRGTLNLDFATQQCALDVFVLFSSIASVMGNVGQYDYAAANGFLDAFSEYRNSLVENGQRSGLTVSVAWPLWDCGGMKVNSTVESAFRDRGFVPLSAEFGLSAFYSAIASRLSGVVVLCGNTTKLLIELSGTGVAELANAPQAMDGVIEKTRRDPSVERIQSLLVRTASRLMKMPEQTIDLDASTTQYGFDSIHLTEFANQLNRTHGLALTPTIFFEYPTLRGLAVHLLMEYRNAFVEFLEARSSSDASAERAATKNGKSLVEISTSDSQPSAETAQRRVDSSAQRVAPIAVIGMSACFPRAGNVAEFWENLLGERDCISEIPRDRWDWKMNYGDPVKDAGKTNVRWGGFIENLDKFDPLFFGIAPREAQLMDPQQRLLLVHAWNAIEDAGYAAESISGSRTAVLIGIGVSSGYEEIAIKSEADIEAYSSTGMMVPSVGPNRISHFFNLHGPSEPIETACSSSLVAMHRATQLIQNGQCEMAIVGGINTLITPAFHISFSKAGMLCEDGRCKTFSKDANGYVRGEGVGMLFLKKLSAAEQDADHIYGVIRGSSENHGGRANSLTAPNPKAQAELIKAAYREAGIDPRSVTYIEAHGTGTPLGDPIEINGLRSAFEELYRDRSLGEGAIESERCGIGSVKTNIGHLELAAGIAGVIKVLLQLKHKKLVKSLHCDDINPYIQLQGTPFYLVRETRPWLTSKDSIGHELPRRAGVSSFGFGGVNAHVIIEEYLAPQTINKQSLPRASPACIVLSAKDEQRLSEKAKQLLAHISENSYTDADLDNLAYTLQVGREAMNCRLGLVVDSLEQLEEKLTRYMDEEESVDGLYEGQVKRNVETITALDGDGELSGLLDEWVSRGKYEKILFLWVRGLSFDWERLYAHSMRFGATKPKRIPLPTYPFEMQRYWIEERAPLSSAAISQESMASSSSEAVLDGASTLALVEQWVPSPLSVAERAWQSLATRKGAQRVLILCPRSTAIEGIRLAFAQIWADNANRLLVETLSLPRGSISDRSPLDEYLASHPVPNAIFYFSDRIEDSAAIDCELRCILQASQSLIARASGKPVQFYYCYEASECVSRVYQEGLSGLFRAIASECPTHRYRSIEYPQSAVLADYVSLVREWLQDPEDQIPAQLPMVRYRNNERYVTALAEQARVELLEGSAQIRKGATYLMVGALGEVGELLCCALAHRYRPRLVILSRRPASDDDVQRKLARISKAGAEVVFRSADITDENRLAEALKDIRTTTPVFDGVFHFARSVADGALWNKTFSSFRHTIAAKVEGALNIDKLTATDPLEFFVIFSSMAAFGIEGSADYGYATAFQNAFARDRNLRVASGERRGRTLALCWGQWGADAFLTEKHRERLERSGFGFIDETTALSFVGKSLRGSGEVVGLVSVTNEQKIRNWYGVEEAKIAATKSSKADFNDATKILLDNLRELSRAEGESFEAQAKALLLDQPHARLLELQDALSG